MLITTENSFLADIQNIAYNIPNYTGDNVIRDKETSEPSHCFECAPRYFVTFSTVLACRHIAHRLCLENRICVKNISPTCLNCHVSIEITKEEFAFASGNYNL
jgi:hypothetical protein